MPLLSPLSYPATIWRSSLRSISRVRHRGAVEFQADALKRMVRQICQVIDNGDDVSGGRVLAVLARTPWLQLIGFVDVQKRFVIRGKNVHAIRGGVCPSPG